jgi:hypothetical protein
VLVTLEGAGAITGAAVVDWVDVVLKDEVCARATPDIIARAIAAASEHLINVVFS